MKEHNLRRSATSLWMRRLTEPTLFRDVNGKILGTWIPAGQEPPESPPEPPEATAAVGAKVPKGPRYGGPGAAAYRPNPKAEEEFGIIPSMSSAYRTGHDD